MVNLFTDGSFPCDFSSTTGYSIAKPPRYSPLGENREIRNKNKSIFLYIFKRMYWIIIYLFGNWDEINAINYTQCAILNTHNFSFSKLDFPQAFKYIWDIMHNKYGGFPYYQKDYKMNDGKVFLFSKVKLSR